MFARMAILPSGAFWSKAALIGVSEDELAASERKELDQKRADEIGFVMKLAAQNLYQAEAKGRG